MKTRPAAIPTAAGGTKRRPVVGIVSLSPIADDPRVRRQGDAFCAAGWEVQAFGLPSRIAAPPDWPILTPDDALTLDTPTAMPVVPDPTRGWRRWVLRLLDGAGHARLGFDAYEARLVSVRVDPGRAELVYWTLNSSFWDLLALATRSRADLWLGNDWTSLPIIARLAAAQGVPYVYDTHEFAAEEFNESNRWRIVQRPVRLHTEGRFIGGAAIVSTVSDGIAERLKAIHRLPVTPLTIRSTPVYQEMPLRPTGIPIRVLYHGAIWEHRGLETCIRSVAAWRPEFDFTIRGPVSDAYRAVLEREIDAAGVRGRVHIVPPVAATDLVHEASVFDIGLFALPSHSQHNEHALPNKFFEYTMAGLALCVTALPEMARLIERYGHGVLLNGIAPEAIAQAINGLNAGTIDGFKRKSLAAARELCWECEQVRMLEAYRTVLTRGKAGQTMSAAG